MGCGGSHQANQVAEVVTVDGKKADEVTPWATKNPGCSSTSTVESATAQSTPGRGGQPQGLLQSQPQSKPQSQPQKTKMADPDDEVEEIEIISEAKPQAKCKVDIGNAQEAPQEAEFFVDVQVETAKRLLEEQHAEERRQHEAMSQRQREEAAKLMEQRKRFDQKCRGGAVAESSPRVGDEPRSNHGMVLGLNLSNIGPSSQGDALFVYSLPGGIAGDTPRDQLTATTKKNNHHLFDDDEEMLMSEILDSVDV